jgi:hemoglobin
MSAPGASGETLYARLGGYDAIAAMVDDLLGRIVPDPALAAYFKGMNSARKVRARQLIVDYLCSVAGGPVHYTGGDMKREHEGLGITTSEWAVFMRHAEAMLGRQGVATRERAEVLDFLTSLEGDVVEAESGGQAQGGWKG